MVFARRSLLRATTAAQSLRTAPITRRPDQVLGRRYYASGKGYEEHKSSDLPWLLGSVGIGVPVIAYLVTSGPEKKPHGAGGHAHTAEEEKEKESPPEPVEEQPKEDGGPPSQEQKVGAEKTGHDEPAGMKPAAGPTSMSAKQEGVSNADAMNPYINEPGKSKKEEGETESVKLKGTVKPQRPQE